LFDKSHSFTCIKVAPNEKKNTKGLLRVMRNNTKITTKTTIEIPFYPRIQLQEAVKEPITREKYTEEVNNLKDLNKT
jgi:hypothetical protein